MRGISRVFLVGISVVLSVALSACGGGGGDGDAENSLFSAKLTSLSIQAKQPNLAAGESTTLQAIGKFSDGTVSDITVNANTGKAVTSIRWSSSDESIAKVESINGATLKTLKQGTVIITATDFFSKVSATQTITVAAPTQTGFAIRGLSDNQTISARTSTMLLANRLMSDGSAVVAPGTSWKTSNAAIATVDANGNFKAVAPGTVTITANSGADTSAITLTLLPPLATPVFTVSCDPAKPTAINAAQWNAQFAKDSHNATEWIAVDGVSCQAHPAVKLLVPFGGSGTLIYTRIFGADRSANTPTVFQPAQTYSGELTAGQEITVGSATSASATSFSDIYTFKLQ